MSSLGHFVADPDQPPEKGAFAEYYSSVKEPLWASHEALSYPIADLGSIPLLQVVKALPYGRIDFSTLVSGQSIVGQPRTSYDETTLDPGHPPNDAIRMQINEIQAYMKLAHAALSPSIAVVAADYRERMDIGPLDINVEVTGSKEIVTEDTDLSDETLDDARWPHLDVRNLWYFASIGKPTRYWPGKFNLSRQDVEDDHVFYQEQIDAQRIPEHALPADSIVAVDRHLLHAIPVFTAEEVPTDRFFVSLTPNHSTPL